MQIFSAMDSRFVSLLKWLGENRINVRLSGVNNSEMVTVYTAFARLRLAAVQSFPLKMDSCSL